jgi:hypothetical protein
MMEARRQGCLRAFFGPLATDGRQLEQVRGATLSRALSVTLSKATGKAYAKARRHRGRGREQFATQLSCIAEEGKRVLRASTLSPHLIKSERASECSGLPFASDALWSPRSPRCIDAAHEWRAKPPGTCLPTGRRRAPACRLFRSLRCACTEPPRPPPRHKLTVQLQKGRASRPRRVATRRGRRVYHHAFYTPRSHD